MYRRKLVRVSRAQERARWKERRDQENARRGIGLGGMWVTRSYEEVYMDKMLDILARYEEAVGPAEGPGTCVRVGYRLRDRSFLHGMPRPCSFQSNISVSGLGREGQRAHHRCRSKIKCRRGSMRGSLATGMFPCALSRPRRAPRSRCSAKLHSHHAQSDMSAVPHEQGTRGCRGIPRPRWSAVRARARRCPSLRGGLRRRQHCGVARAAQNVARRRMTPGVAGTPAQGPARATSH